MIVRAAHPFKVQTLIGVFLHFETGQKIPEDLLAGPYREYIMEHCSDDVLKPKLIVPEAVQKAQEALNKAEVEKSLAAQKLAEMQAKQSDEPRETIEPAAAMVKKPPPLKEPWKQPAEHHKPAATHHKPAAHHKEHK